MESRGANNSPTLLMPLQKGSSKTVIKANIGEMMHSWKKDGCIGNACTANSKKASQIAAAAAYSKAGKSNKK